MTKRVFNFSAGPATLPLPVLQQIQEEFLNYQDIGASIIEISHFSDEVRDVVAESEHLLRELLNIPSNYAVGFAHGGGQMQFSMTPLNLLGYKPKQSAQYVLSGSFSERALTEAERFGDAKELASSKAEAYSGIPQVAMSEVDPDASYLHITSNNTAVGTRWPDFPNSPIPLVADMTSELLSRQLDISQFGLIYAGAQKNLGPPGVAVFIIRDELLGHALPQTPKLLNYHTLIETHSLLNTINVFSVYIMSLVLKWVKDNGGVAAQEALNEKKAGVIYDALDQCLDFYVPHAQPKYRSTMNVTFKLKDDLLEEKFLTAALKENLYALKGHSFLGGIRASIYNTMPLEGAESMAQFITDFAKQHG